MNKIPPPPPVGEPDKIVQVLLGQTSATYDGQGYRPIGMIYVVTAKGKILEAEQNDCGLWTDITPNID